MFGAISAIGNVVGGVLAGRGAKKAAQTSANAQVESQRMAIEAQKEAEQTARADLAPYSEFGQEQMSQLSGIMGQPSQEQQQLLGQAAQLRGQSGAEMLQNPILQALQKDISRRVMANQAARGALGTGNTATALTEATMGTVAPLAMQMRENDITGLTQLAREYGGIRQQNIQNLFGGAQIGANAAARTGQGAMSTGLGVAGAYGNIGAAQSQGILGAAAGRNYQIGAVTSGLQQLAGSFAGGGSGGGGGLNPNFRPTAASLSGLGLGG